jgi:hypothetical protein
MQDHAIASPDLGTVFRHKDKCGNDRFLTVSKHKPSVVDRLDCWSLEGANFYLWVINERVRGRIGRTGR